MEIRFKIKKRTPKLYQTLLGKLSTIYSYVEIYTKKNRVGFAVGVPVEIKLF
jgi:hypothetical protein